MMVEVKREVARRVAERPEQSGLSAETVTRLRRDVLGVGDAADTGLSAETVGRLRRDVLGVGDAADSFTERGEQAQYTPIVALLNAVAVETPQAWESMSTPEDWTTYPVCLPEHLRGWSAVDVVLAEDGQAPSRPDGRNILDQVLAEGRTLSVFLLLARPQAPREQAVQEFLADASWGRAVHRPGQSESHKEWRALRAYALLPLAKTSEDRSKDQSVAEQFSVHVRRWPLGSPLGCVATPSVGDDRPAVITTAMAVMAGRYSAERWAR